MKKICFLQHGLGYGGATKSLLQLQEILKDEFEIHTICLPVKNQKLKDLFINSKRISEIDIPCLYSHDLGTISIKQFEKAKDYFPSKLINYVNENKIEILHINSSLFSNILASIKKATKCKIIVHLREILPNGSDNEIDNYIINNTVGNSDSIIAISDNEILHYPKSPKIHVLPNFHDFSESDQYLNIDNRTSKTIIGMVSNFKWFKGHLIFLEAIRKILSTNIEYQNEMLFKIVGYPNKHSIKNLLKEKFPYSYQYKFNKAIRRYNLEKNIIVIPFKIDIYKELSSFDILIRPDLMGLPWGRDIIEAMALKKAVIATGSSEFFIENSVNGYLVPPNNSDELAKKIIELVNNKDKRQFFGENAYIKVRDMCNVERYKKTLLSIYNKLL